MTTGTGPQALVSSLLTNWQPTRTDDDGNRERPDVPDVIRDSGTPSNDPNDADGPGKVLIVNDRDVVANQHATYDLIHCYHPQAGPVSIEDNGYDEVRETETVQIDIEVTNRPDPDTGERLNAKDLLVGDRDDPEFPADESPPYPGIKGEVKYILETGRRGLEEWDVASYDTVNVFLGNSNANWSYSVELEHIARNTVQ